MFEAVSPRRTARREAPALAGGLPARGYYLELDGAPVTLELLAHHALIRVPGREPRRAEGAAVEDLRAACAEPGLPELTAERHPTLACDDRFMICRDDEVLVYEVQFGYFVAGEPWATARHLVATALAASGGR